MPYLIADGPDEVQRWRRPLPVGRTFMLGREAEFAVPWDPAISRRHAELLYSDGELRLRRLADAQNPIFFHGRAADRAVFKPGDSFVIGQTRFTLLDEHAAVTLDAPHPDVQQTFTSADLRALRYSDAGSRIDVLSRLPEVIAGATDDADLHTRLVNVLLLGIRNATAAALVAVQSAERVDVLHWDRRGSGQGDFHPSRRLIQEAVRQQQSVLHIWRDGAGAEFTVAEQADWAFATPLPGESCRGWALFVAGRAADTASGGPTIAARRCPPPVLPAPQRDGLKDDLKFAELVAGAVAAWRDNQHLRKRQAAMATFFSPQVLAAIGRDDPQQVLAPRRADVTVMFCDLRGFSLATEQAPDLMELLTRVSRALGVVTRQIFDHAGVIGDFHGDAVMGFWGWPMPQPDRAALACRTALAVQEQLSGESDFRVGIGIASGQAVAGQIGTDDQAKVTVFGPVVNLAARLEALTRRLGADILLDVSTEAEIVTGGCRKLDALNQLEGRVTPAGVVIATGLGTDARMPRMPTIVPYGLHSPLPISRLLPPERECPDLSDAALEDFDGALTEFNCGRWDAARQRLDSLAARDPAAGFLLSFMREHNNQPPPNFDGVIRMTTK